MVFFQLLVLALGTLKASAADDWIEMDMYHIIPANLTSSKPDGIANHWLGDLGQAAYYSIRGWYGWQMCKEGKGEFDWPLGRGTPLGLGGCSELREMLPLNGFVYGHVKVRVLQPFGAYSTCAYSRKHNDYVCSCGGVVSLPIPYLPIPCPGNHVGKAPAHGGSVSVGGKPYDGWHKMIVNKMANASWYNAPAKGQCNGGDGCTWEVIKYVRTTASDCHLDAVIPLFEERDPTCFHGCSDGRYSTCWSECMFGKVLPSMTGSDIGLTWSAGFDKCPNVLQQQSYVQV